MTAIIPPPNVLTAQQTFRTLLGAMARPGTILTLPNSDETAHELTICLTLLDYQSAYAIANSGTHPEAMITALEARIRLETGCIQVAVPDAAFVLTYGPLPEEAWPELHRGTLAFPDRGATIIYVLPAVGEIMPGTTGKTVMLTGPGIAHTQALTVSGLDATELARLAAVNRDYPMGVDAILIDQRGRIACIPRSSRIAAEEG